MSLAQLQRDRAARARDLAQMATADDERVEAVTLQAGARVRYIRAYGPVAMPGAVAMPGDTGTVVGTVTVASGRIDRTLFEVEWDAGAWLAGTTSCCWPVELEILAAEPQSFVVAPLGDHWTVMTPDGASRIRTRQPWNFAMATLAKVGLTDRPGRAAQFDWAEVA